MHRFCLKITGESGGGLLSTGEIIMNAFKDLGFYIVADREYPSLIKGGHACFSINISTEPVYSLTERVDIMLSIDKQSLEAYFKDLRGGGTLIYGYERPLGVKDIIEEAGRRKVKVVHQMAREIADNAGGNVLMTNVVLVGMFWKVLGLPFEYIENAVREKFKNKPKILEIDLKCVKAGYESCEKILDIELPRGLASAREKKILMDGNKALALGAIHAGCRFYVAYPMSPSSTILTHFAETAKETGVLVKQGEDEITVVNMALGAMFMGTRALCATSGGGYDLMTETVSLAGMIETPLVVILAQRPGPATGLPTWTAQTDLNLAMYSSHGEFPRVVLAVSDPADCFELIQHAFNLAEKYQTVVLVLTEKVIAESDVTIKPFKQGRVKIERGLVSGGDLKKLVNEDRFRVTDSGLSKRWIVGSSDAYYFGNSDEHWEDGSLTEEADQCEKMYAKRMRKMELITKAVPEPKIYGVTNGADISFIGWGSCKNVMLDIIRLYAEKKVKVNYLHYSYVYPFKMRAAQEFFRKNKNVNLIEGNYQGQLGNIVEAAVSEANSYGNGRNKGSVKGIGNGFQFKKRLLKYNGRPFFTDDVEKFINKNLR